LVPVTVSGNAAPPAKAVEGAKPVPSVLMVGEAPTVNVMPLETAPAVPPTPSGFRTVIRAVPAAVSNDEGTRAVSVPDEPKAVDSAVAEPPLLHSTVDPLRKFEPVTVRANVAAPTPADVGATDEMVGPKMVTAKGAEVGVVLPMVVEAVSETVPAWAIRLTGTSTVTCVALARLGCRMVVVTAPVALFHWDHWITVLLSKFVPVTDRITPGLPATIGEGATDVMLSDPTEKISGGCVVTPPALST
jgi:hypothetical protein